MEKHSYKKIIKDLGLSENESSVYLAALSLGPTTAISLARSTGMRRTTVYTVIEALKQKGLMRTEVFGLKQKYVAEHPDNLSEMLRRKREKLDSILPDLSSLYSLGGEESVIKLHEGIPAIRKVYESVLSEIKRGDFFYVVSDTDKFVQNDPEFFEEYIEKRRKIGVDIKALLRDSKRADYYKKYEKNYNLQVKAFPEDRELVANITITPKKLIIYQTDDPRVIVVENKAVIDLQKNMFEMLWGAL